LSSIESVESAIETWVELFNSDPHRMIDECYAKDATVSIPGLYEFYDLRPLHRAEAATLSAFPNRRVTVLRTHVYGDFAVVEAAYTFASGIRDSYFCTLLEFREGLIISDRTYMTSPPPEIATAQDT